MKTSKMRNRPKQTNKKGSQRKQIIQEAKQNIIIITIMNRTMKNINEWVEEVDETAQKAGKLSGLGNNRKDEKPDQFWRSYFITELPQKPEK